MEPTHDIESLPNGVRQGEDGEILIPATVDGSSAIVRCSVEGVVNLDTVSTLGAVDAGDFISFHCEQGRGEGTVTEVQESADGTGNTIRVAAGEESEDEFTVTVHDEKQPTATHIEYISEDNSYEEWPLGAVTRVSVEE